MRNILLVMTILLLSSCNVMNVGTVSVYTNTGEHFATYNAVLSEDAAPGSGIKLGGILNFYDMDAGNYKLVSGGIIVCDYKTVVDRYNGNEAKYKSVVLALYSRFKKNYEDIESLPKGSVVRCPISNVEFVKKSKNNNFYNDDCGQLYDACTKLGKYSRPADYKYIVDEYNKIKKNITNINF